eukprot:Seg3014.2 transcript_id=Seg3014.2/GoldUCD/mRNA.D3Y31 product="Neuropeptide FF receptor 2" protein_id=Seg3014.2/GoldUCD/D3Y31
MNFSTIKLNMTNMTSYNTTAATKTTTIGLIFDKPYPPLIKQIGFAILPIIIVLSLVGNSLVIHLTRKYKILKVATMRIFVINLAVCNIILVFFPSLYLLELATGDWHFGGAACNALVVFEYAALTSANLSHVHIAFERLTAIVKPFKAKMGKKATGIMLLVTWLLGIPLAVPFVVMQNRYIDDDHPGAAAQPECQNMWAVTTVGMPKKSLIYFSVLFVLLYVLPAVFMTICYAKVIHRLLNKMKRPGHQTDESKKQEQQLKLRTVQLLLTTVIVFKLFWLPSYIQEFLLAGGVENKSDNLRIQVINLLCAAFGYVYCALTPFLYFVFNAKYRKAFREMKQSVSSNLSGVSLRNAYSLNSMGTPKTTRSTVKPAMGTPKIARFDYGATVKPIN